MKSQKKVKLKVTVIGDPQSGKSSFIQNLVNRSFSPEYTMTQNFQITIFNLTNNNTEYEIYLWDCGGNFWSANKFLRKAFFRNSSASFLMFNLCSPKWRQTLPRWVQQAYDCQAFLLYAIGTKRDCFDHKNIKEKPPLLNRLINNKTLQNQSEKDQLTSEYEYENNLLFDEYQIKHFYQSATAKIPYEIENIFVSINDDKQKLSRSSLAKGTKFSNSLIEGQMQKFKQQQKQNERFCALKKCQAQGIIKFSIIQTL